MKGGLQPPSPLCFGGNTGRIHQISLRGGGNTVYTMYSRPALNDGMILDVCKKRVTLLRALVSSTSNFFVCNLHCFLLMMAWPVL